MRSIGKVRSEMGHMQKSERVLQWTTLLAIAAAVVLLDQLTKYGAATLDAPMPITKFFSLQFSTNTGAAFSTFTAYPQLLTLIALAAVIGIPFLFRRMPTAALSLSLIWGGAAGNLIDRLTIGAVRDFIAFSFWPSFNVADAAITVGVLWIILIEWKEKQR